MIHGLYTVLKQDLEQVTLQLSSESHPIFQAHFPNYPILPGFALIDIIADILNDNVVNIVQCKFIAHIQPNDVLICNIKNDQKKRNIKVFKNEEKVSEITYESN